MKGVEMNIPALRFPGFEGEWELKKLGEVSTYTKGYAFKSEDYQTEGERIIRVSDLGATTIKHNEEMIFIDNSKIKGLEKYEIKKNEIIITTVGSKPEMTESAVGRGILITKSNEGYLNQNLLKINYSDEIDNRFIFGVINSKKYTNHINQIQRGNANQSNITVNDLFDFELFFPTLPEQNKIAGFLSSVDEKLQQLKQEKAHLAQYKKGVMQQIFNQEIRFKDDDGSAFPEWEEKSLGDVCEIKKGEQLNVTELSNNGSYAALNGGINPSGYTEKWNTDANTIAISEGGNSCGYVNFIKNKFWSGGHCYSLKNIQTYIDSFYLFQFLKYIEPSIMRLRVGSGLPNIQKTALSDLNIQFPNKLEQTKIANFLSAIDDNITNITNQLTLTEQWKKGLLQKMFV